MSHYVECPLCFKNFSSDFIEIHAQKCKGNREKNCDTSDVDMPAAKKAKIVSSQKSLSKNFFSPTQSRPTHSSSSNTKIIINAKEKRKSPFNTGSKFASKLKSIGNNASPGVTQTIPLAERSRPSTVEDFMGQDKIFKENSVLSELLKYNVIPSMIFWGPPGCGKTSLANVIAVRSKNSTTNSYRFVKLSATSSGKAEVQAAAEAAKNDWKMFKRRTILFIDEIHRFNKLQQDTFLPHVEDGTIVLIGATTENPSFSLNSALLSRCRIVVLEKLAAGDVQKILMKTLQKFESDIVVVKSDMRKYEEKSPEKGKNPVSESDLESKSQTDSNIDGIHCLTESHDTLLHGNSSVSSENVSFEHETGDCDIIEIDHGKAKSSNISISEEAVFALANLCDGDARIALSGLQMSIQAARAVTSNSPDKVYHIDLNYIKKCFQRSHVLYDRKGDQHYDIASAFQKSIRGSDDNAALYWLTRMLEGGEDPRFIARRLIIIASEDIGLADSSALNLAVSTQQACEFVGKPECGIVLAHCTVYMARAPKSPEACLAYVKAKECIKNHEGPLPGVPLHLRNAPTQLMKSLGYGKNYSYAPSVDQTYMPDDMLDVNFFT